MAFAKLLPWKFQKVLSYLRNGTEFSVLYRVSSNYSLGYQNFQFQHQNKPNRHNELKDGLIIIIIIIDKKQQNSILR